jgi:adenine-specific DNA-methyltransferase
MHWKCNGCKGLIFNESDLDQLISNNKKVFLFDAAENLSEGDVKYLEYGKKLNVDKRYLTSKRAKWYIQEKRMPSPIWACVFNRQNIKFIYNDTSALNLTTFHCLYPKSTLSKVELKALVAILNHDEMTQFVMEQRRVYGGGLAKFEPKDLLDIRIPNFMTLPKKIINDLANELDEADKCFRDMKEYKFNITLSQILENCENINVRTMIQQELL